MSKIVWQRIDVTCRNASHFKKARDLDLSPCALWVLVWPARHVITLLTQISGFVHRALDGFSIGWKIWRVAWFTLNSSLFSYSRTGWILTFVRGLTIGPCAERVIHANQIKAPPSWFTTHPCNHACCRKIKKVVVFAYRFSQIFDCIGLNYVLDFGSQI